MPKSSLGKAQGWIWGPCLLEFLKLSQNPLGGGTLGIFKLRAKQKNTGQPKLIEGSEGILGILFSRNRSENPLPGFPLPYLGLKWIFWPWGSPGAGQRKTLKKGGRSAQIFSPELAATNFGKTWFKKAFLCQTFLGRVLREQSGFSLGKGVFSPHFLPRPFALKTLKLFRPWEQGFSAQV